MGILLLGYGLNAQGHGWEIIWHCFVVNLFHIKNGYAMNDE